MSAMAETQAQSQWVQTMEPRRLLAGPAVVSITMTGTEQETTGIILTFSAPLDPVTAQNPKAYFVGRTEAVGEAGYDPLGLYDRPRETKRVNLQSAVYDPATTSVALRPAAPFNLFDRFRRVRISGKGDNAVKDAAGVTIDGNHDDVPGGDSVIRTRLVRSKRVNFTEADGDRAHLRLHGPGKIWAVVAKNKQTPPVLFLNRSNALKSGLTGSVQRHQRTGDGVVTIRQISGTTFASLPILGDPAFRVELVSP